MQKKEKPSPEESEPQYHFQGQSTRSQHWFHIDPDRVEESFMSREPYFSKDYTLNVFESKQIRIVFNVMLQLDVQNLQVMFNLSQTTLLWPTRNMTKNRFLGSLSSALKVSNQLTDTNAI